MRKLKIDCESCYEIKYGIKKLGHEFDSSEGANIVYAPNGTMKDSLSKILEDFSKNKEPKG